MPTRAPVARELRLLDRLAAALHQRRFTPAVVRNYVSWVRRYVVFHHVHHPGEMGIPEVTAFLDYHAGPVEATLFEIAEAGQALRFLYEVLLEKPLAEWPWPQGVPRVHGAGLPALSPRLLDQMRHLLRVRRY